MAAALNLNDFRKKLEDSTSPSSRAELVKELAQQLHLLELEVEQLRSDVVGMGLDRTELDVILGASKANSKVAKSGYLKPLVLMIVCFFVPTDIWSYSNSYVDQTVTYLVSELTSTYGVKIQTWSDQGSIVFVRGEKSSGFDELRFIRRFEIYTGKALRFDLSEFMVITGGTVLQEISNQIEPPDSVYMSMQGETLNIKGVASKEWIANARSFSPSDLNVKSVDSSQLEVLEAVLNENLLEQSVNVGENNLINSGEFYGLMTNFAIFQDLVTVKDRLFYIEIVSNKPLSVLVKKSLTNQIKNMTEGHRLFQSMPLRFFVDKQTGKTTLRLMQLAQ